MPVWQMQITHGDINGVRAVGPTAMDQRWLHALAGMDRHYSEPLSIHPVSDGVTWQEHYLVAGPDATEPGIFFDVLRILSRDEVGREIQRAPRNSEIWRKLETITEVLIEYTARGATSERPANPAAVQALLARDAIQGQKWGDAKAYLRAATLLVEDKLQEVQSEAPTLWEHLGV